MGAALAGAVVFTTSPANAELVETNYAFEASGYGTRIIIPDVQLQSDRTGWAHLGCTRLAGKNKVIDALAVDTKEAGIDLLKIGAVDSTNRTYKDVANGVRAGVEATNSIAFLRIGDPQLVDASLLKIEGLTTKAEAWVDNNGEFHTRETAGALDIKLSLLDGTPIDGALQDLLDALLGDTGILKQVIGALKANDGSIEIPGLGKLYLDAFKEHKISATNAQSTVQLLKFVIYGADGVEGGDAKDSTIVIGSSYARIRKAPADLMHGTAFGLTADVLGGLASVGNVAEQPLNCTGTKGEDVSAHTVMLLDKLGGFVDTGDISGTVMGNQFLDGSAVARTIGGLADLKITDGAGTEFLSIEALLGRVNIKTLPNGKIAPGFPNIQNSQLLNVVINGTPVGEILPNTEMEIPGLGRIVFLETNRPVDAATLTTIDPETGLYRAYRQLSVVAAHVYILEGVVADSVVDLKLGVARANISQY
jgi:hypothetical protein